jgi:anaerobic ribonucleoside-triphosphate reductase activating protein
LKTAWYSGVDVINRGDVIILKHLDFVKLGHYDLELGGLDSPTTNQRLYKRVSDSNYLNDWEDITYKLQNNEN